ncbi:MAG TPA: hypothetical protein VF223_11750 [Trebonia sp.]
MQQQTELGRRVCREQDRALSERHIYEDANLSAPRFTTKDRPVWQRLRRSVRTDQLDVRKSAPPFPGHCAGEQALSSFLSWPAAPGAAKITAGGTRHLTGKVGPDFLLRC